MDHTVWTRNGYITAADASRAIGVPASSVHRWMKTGKLPHALQGRKHFVKVEELVAFVRRTWSDPAVSELVVDSIRRVAREGSAQAKKKAKR